MWNIPTWESRIKPKLVNSSLSGVFFLFVSHLNEKLFVTFFLGPSPRNLEGAEQSVNEIDAKSIYYNTLM